MQLGRRLLFAALAAFFLFAGRPVRAADDLQRVLHQLDQAAKGFRTVSADVKIEIVQTEPVPNTDVQTGTLYFKHEGNQVLMALRYKEQDGHPYPAVVTYSQGVAQLYQKNLDQVTRYQNAANFAGYLTLGFGAAGRDMADKFNITYLGQETLDGVQTDKLQLVAKDPKILRMFPKITVWIDPVRDVSLKMIMDEGQGMSRTSTFSNIQVNRPIPADNFTFKTDKKTTFSNQ